LRLTSPLVIPVRRVIPPVGRLDTATIIVAFGLQYFAVFLILSISGVTSGIVPIATTSLIDIVLLSLQLFKFAIFIHIVLSWVAPGTHNPATAFISMLVEPVLRPFRNLIPAIGGLDISPIFAIIALQASGIYIATLRPFAI